MINLSIIIPHKNSVKLLERLLRSIPEELKAQVIVVDDGSCDDEILALDNLSKSVSFELYSNNRGLGAGAARNEGLKHATGEWILFADADDFFLDTLAETITQYQNSDYDIVFFNISSCYSDTLEPSYRNQHIKSITSKFQQTNEEGYLRFKYLSPWGKLIKRSLLVDNAIEFDEVIAGNDMMFSVLSGLAAGKIHYDPTAIYMLTLSAGSITTTLTQDRFDSRFMVTLRMNKLLRESKQGKYQASVLYFLGKAHQFGFAYMLHVFKMSIRYRANIFIGMGKILNYRSVLSRREAFQKK